MLASVTVAALAAAEFPVLGPIYMPALDMALAMVALGISVAVVVTGWSSFGHVRRDTIAIVAAFLGIGLLCLGYLALNGTSSARSDFALPHDSALHYAVGLLAAAGIFAASRLAGPVPPLAGPRQQALAVALGVLAAVALGALALAAPGHGTPPPVQIVSTVLPGVAAMLYVWAGLRLYSVFKRDPGPDTSCLLLATVTGIFAELLLGLDAGDPGIYDLLGHVYRIIGFILVYVATFHQAARGPYFELKRAQQQVAASERRFQSLLELSTDWYWEQDSEFRFTVVEGWASPAFGAPPSYYLGRRRWELPAINMSEEDWQAHRAVLNAHKPFQGLLLKVPNRDGEMCWASISGRPIFDRHGQFSGYCGVARDVTRLKNADNALRESEERLRATFEQAAVGIALIRLDGRFLYVNHRLCEIFGRSAAEMTGSGLDSVIDPASASWAEVGAMLRLTSEGRPASGELRLNRRGDDETWISLHLSLCRDAGGAAQSAVVVVQDISDRRRVEDALRKEQDLLAQAQKIARLGRWEWDVANDLILASEEAYRMFGLPVQEAGMAYRDFLDSVYREDRDKVIASANAALHEGVPYSIDYRIFRPDRTVRTVHSEAQVFRDDAGKPLRLVGTIQDITVRVAVEQALRESQTEVRRMNAELERRVEERTRQLAAANKELEAFSYSVSHDLQAPLRRIERYAELLQETNRTRLDESGRDMLKRILGASAHTKRLIEDMLKLAMVSRTDLKRTSVDVSGLARTLLEQLGGHSAPVREVEVEIDDRISVEADAAMLRILLDNLLGNAWKFTGRTVRARIKVGRITRPGGNGFYVQDNGAGFDMRYAHKLFGAFQRLHGQDEFQGSGIGLAIVQRIVNLHGWHIEASGGVGEGATFTVTTA